jgi:uridine phosphorylase
MVKNGDAVIIESRTGPREKPCAALAIMACVEMDRRRFCRVANPAPHKTRKIYNTSFQDVIYANRSISVVGPVLGAPQAVLVLEKLIALGSRTIVVFGWCGSLQKHVEIGEWLLPSAARSEEGTSVHYPLPSGSYAPDAVLFDRLRQHCERNGHFVHTGPVWTTDAPLRETVAKVKTYASEGVLGVEMEMSALFRVATYRKVRLAGLLTVSDELSSLKWRHGFRSNRFKRSCSQATETLLDFCASLPPTLTE